MLINKHHHPPTFTSLGRAYQINLTCLLNWETRNRCLGCNRFSLSCWPIDGPRPDPSLFSHSPPPVHRKHKVLPISKTSEAAVWNKTIQRLILTVYIFFQSQLNMVKKKRYVTYSKNFQVSFKELKYTFFSYFSKYINAFSQNPQVYVLNFLSQGLLISQSEQVALIKPSLSWNILG